MKRLIGSVLIILGLGAFYLNLKNLIPPIYNLRGLILTLELVGGVAFVASGMYFGFRDVLHWGSVKLGLSEN